jgi:hypothetical protein
LPMPEPNRGAQILERDDDTRKSICLGGVVWRAPRGLDPVALSDFLSLRRDLLLSERQKLAEVGSQKYSFKDKFRGKIMRVCRWMKIIPKNVVIRVGVRISS